MYPHVCEESKSCSSPGALNCSLGVFEPRFDFIVNLTGSAEIYLHEAEEMKRIWQQIADRSRAFFMQDPAKGPGFVVIHTKVETIECTLPRKVVTVSINPVEMREAFATAKA